MHLADTRNAAAVCIAITLGAGSTGCSVKRFAINKIGDSLASSGSTFASDDDLELVGQAVPFSLKLIESLLSESPKHQGLLLAAASGFTQYAYVYVHQEADFLESHDLEKADALRSRARRLYLRARDYGLRGLEGRYPAFRQQLRLNADNAVHTAKRSDVALLYWTAAAWGSAISVSKNTPDLIADQPLVQALIDRAYKLDPDFEAGAIESFLINYEPARQGTAGDASARARQHFERAVALTGGGLASPFVSLAEAVSVPNQDRAEFESLLKRALAIEADRKPECRLQNLAAQRRARWLIEREDDLFIK